jgi:hypothetical protein
MGAIHVVLKNTFFYIKKSYTASGKLTSRDDPLLL